MGWRKFVRSSNSANVSPAPKLIICCSNWWSLSFLLTFYYFLGCDNRERVWWDCQETFMTRASFAELLMTQKPSMLDVCTNEFTILNEAIMNNAVKLWRWNKFIVQCNYIEMQKKCPSLKIVIHHYIFLHRINWYSAASFRIEWVQRAENNLYLFVNFSNN